MRHLLLLAFAPALLSAQADTSRARRDSAQRLEGVTVSAIRARERAPVASTAIDATTIERRSFGQDVPLLLQGTPSLVSHSETGGNWGYSYLRIRGIDQTRINITLDGIPLNDPEDQGLYFADFPDLSNSLASVQIQRGVGTSAPGTASYGGSVNLQTLPVTSRPRGVESEVQAGSFGSYRASGEYASGLMPGGFAVHSRASVIRSSGFRDHSGMTGRSAFASAAWVGARDVVKLTALVGIFADTLAYLGATAAELAANERANLLRPDEVDQFSESVVGLTHTRRFGRGVTMSNTLYRTSATGDYDVCVNNCGLAVGDLWNFNLDFTWFGATSVAEFDAGRAHVTTGINANTYARDHHAYARPDLATPLYFNTGHKTDASAFVKVAVDAGRATLFGDVQARRAAFRYEPTAGSGVPESSVDWTFINPKVGATVRVRDGLDAYASFGVNGREPGRIDLLGGLDDLDSTTAGFVGPLSRVRAERVLDTEAGARLRGARWSLDANLFAMEFRDEILPVGRLTIIGTPLRTNVISSWRRGLELDASASVRERLHLSLTTTLMRARISQFTDGAAAVVFRDVPPLLTPEFTSAHRATFDVTPTFSVGLAGRFIGNSRLSLTDDPTLALPSSYTLDLSSHWTNGPYGISLFVNNATNSRRYASGHVSFGEARYYILPPVNGVLLVRVLVGG